MRSSSARSVVVLLTILLNIHIFGVQAERKLKLHKLEKFKEDTRFFETNLSFVEVEDNVVKVKRLMFDQVLTTVYKDWGSAADQIAACTGYVQ